MTSQPKSFWWAMASAAVAVLGSFGPWAKVLGIISVNGTDGDGWIVIVAALVAVALIILRERRGLRLWSLILAAVAGGLGVATAIYDWADLSRIADQSGLIDAGWGIYLAAFGSVSLVLACIGLGFEKRTASEPVPEVPQPRE
jgi:hypothetical protein